MIFGEKKKDINDLPEAVKGNGGAIIDVRTCEEYDEGHIPNAENHPLDEIHVWSQDLGDKDRLLCVYCYFGARAGAAVKQLKREGYTNVQNYGAVKYYKGDLEK